MTTASLPYAKEYSKEESPQRLQQIQEDLRKAINKWNRQYDLPLHFSIFNSLVMKLSPVGKNLSYIYPIVFTSPINIAYQLMITYNEEMHMTDSQIVVVI